MTAVTTPGGDATSPPCPCPPSQGAQLQHKAPNTAGTPRPSAYLPGGAPKFNRATSGAHFCKSGVGRGSLMREAEWEPRSPRVPASPLCAAAFCARQSAMGTGRDWGDWGGMGGGLFPAPSREFVPPAGEGELSTGKSVRAAPAPPFPRSRGV